MRAESGLIRPHCRTQASRRQLAGGREHRVAHLRKNVHVLVAIDEIRRPAEFMHEQPDLRRDLGVKRRTV